MWCVSGGCGREGLNKLFWYKDGVVEDYTF